MTTGQAMAEARRRWPKRGGWAAIDKTYRGRVWPCAVGVHENRDPIRRDYVRQYVLGVGDTWEQAFERAEKGGRK